MDISKVVIPAAGLGTRFLPYSKAIPKEMLPLGNKPAMQLSVEECVASTLTNIIVVAGKHCSTLLNHFDFDAYLQDMLQEKQITGQLSEFNKLLRSASFSYIRQAEPLGLGHAIWLARHVIQKEYFGVCLPDDVIVNNQPGLAQLIRIARQEKGSVIAVQEIPAELAPMYGVVGIKKQISTNLFQVSHAVEKPSPKDAPSNLAIVGRYVLSHKIFTALEDISSYAHEELQLTDALSRLVHLNERVFAYKIQGTRYDIGTPVGWLKAIVGCSWNDPHYGPALRAFVQDLQNLRAQVHNSGSLIADQL